MNIMKDTDKPPAIRSVLVAVDDACSNRETLETAAHLAADLHAELQGLYVEDIDVLRMAALPFTAEITAASGVVHPIDAESMERAMQHKAEHVRRLMERTAARVQIRCSFSVARGHVTQRALPATGEADLVVFGSRSHAPAVRPPAGERTGATVRPIVAVVDAAAVSARMLDTAAAISQARARGLIVLICGGQRQAGEQLARHVREELGTRGLDVHVPSAPVDTVADLIAVARTSRAELLLLSRACRLLDEVAVQTLLENLSCPFVLV